MEGTEYTPEKNAQLFVGDFADHGLRLSSHLRIFLLSLANVVSSSQKRVKKGVDQDQMM